MAGKIWTVAVDWMVALHWRRLPEWVAAGLDGQAGEQLYLGDIDSGHLEVRRH